MVVKGRPGNKANFRLYGSTQNARLLQGLLHMKYAQPTDPSYQARESVPLCAAITFRPSVPRLVSGGGLVQQRSGGRSLSWLKS